MFLTVVLAGAEPTISDRLSGHSSPFPSSESIETRFVSLPYCAVVHLACDISELELESEALADIRTVLVIAELVLVVLAGADATDDAQLLEARVARELLRGLH